MNKYERWIEEYLEKKCPKTLDGSPSTLGMCGGATSDMVGAFPELRRVRGYAMTADGGSPAHWWCETPQGQVIDPTQSQFDKNGGVIYYEEYSEEKHGPLPIGKCYNCGFYTYKEDYSESFCTVECEQEALNEFNSAV